MNQLRQTLGEVRKKFKNITVAASTVVISSPAFAGGLTKAKTVLDSFLSDYTLLIPTVATIILIGLALAYSWKLINKSDLIQFGVGTIVAGSAATIVAAFIG
jgi:hypothetical protein